ncbi:MAG: SRPBCC domain-containing protein [Rhodospirillaceae bacterium]|nr:SRPBCC domain-containing protein [Rhodospirillaceae bacterium]
MIAESKTPSAPEADREFVITRVFNAPARIVFEAWTKPEHIKRWFGPVGYPVTTADMDFRVGGKFRFVMTGPDGKEGPPFGGEYLEIVPDRKIVLTDAFEEPGSPVMIFTVTFDEKDGKTTQTWRVVFPTADVLKSYREMGMVEGINSGLDQLEDLVKVIR